MIQAGSVSTVTLNVPIMDTSRLINVFVMSATGETYVIFLDVLELEKAVPSMESATQSPTTVTVSLVGLVMVVS